MGKMSVFNNFVNVYITIILYISKCLGLRPRDDLSDPHPKPPPPDKIFDRNEIAV